MKYNYISLVEKRIFSGPIVEFPQKEIPAIPVKPLFPEDYPEINTFPTTMKEDEYGRVSYYN
jgi:hypothetical protein